MMIMQTIFNRRDVMQIASDDKSLGIYRPRFVLLSFQFQCQHLAIGYNGTHIAKAFFAHDFFRIARDCWHNTILHYLSASISCLYKQTWRNPSSNGGLMMPRSVMMALT